MKPETLLKLKKIQKKDNAFLATVNAADVHNDEKALKKIFGATAVRKMLKSEDAALLRSVLTDITAMGTPLGTLSAADKELDKEDLSYQLRMIGVRNYSNKPLSRVFPSLTKEDREEVKTALKQRGFQFRGNKIRGLR